MVKVKKQHSLPGESSCCCLACSSLIQISIIGGVFIIVFLPAIIRLFTSFENEIPIVHDNIFITNSTLDNNNSSIVPEQEVSVILFTWPDANTDTDMAKYIQMYSNQGYKTVTYTIPWTYNFIDGEKIPKAAQDFGKFILNHPELHQKPIFFHVFSNLGCTMYLNFMLLQNEDMKKMIDFKGVIFDSCPGKLSIKSFFNTMGFVLGGNVLRRKTVPIFYFVYFLWKKLLRIAIESEKIEPMFWWDQYYYFLENSENDTSLFMPQLYIYSQSDVCVSQQDIKEVVKKQRQKSGYEVTEYQFQESPHVGHFDKYPDEYQELCLDFFQKNTFS